MTETELIDTVNELVTQDAVFCQRFQQAVATKDLSQIRQLIRVALANQTQDITDHALERVVQWFAN